MSGVSSTRTAFLGSVAFTLLCALSLTACGGSATPLGGSGGSGPGFPEVATKNTTRVAGDGTANRAAAVALAVWPGAGQRPGSIAFLPGDWQSGLAAAPLASPPFSAAFLMADGDIPDPTSQVMDQLDPTGVVGAQNVKRIRIGGAEDPGNASRIDGDNPAQLADAVDQSRANAGARLTDSVVVVGTSEPAWAMPAAAWAARSGDPILFSDRDNLPDATKTAIRRHGHPLIMLLAPEAVVSKQVEQQLAAIGTVTRITADTPAGASVAFARFRDGDRGWGLNDPGHGYLFINPNDPLNAAVAAPLSASGTWAATLLTDSSDQLPKAVDQYLRDVQPGFREDPTRAVYNHGWLMGGTGSISQSEQADIDRLLEIVPANERLNP